MAEAAVDRHAIEAAERLIRPHVRLTPVVTLDGRELGLGCRRVTFKLEQTQLAGSFKARGAFANLLTREVPAAGVVAASGGNHGAAVAHAAARLGIPARIYVPTISSPAKVARIREAGAELVVTGDLYADALAESEDWRARSGAMAIHAYDSRETMAGQGTIGLELASQACDIDTALVAVGGGGLIGGIAAWFAGEVRIVAVEPEACPCLAMALDAGRPVDAPAGGFAADSLGARRVGEHVFPLVRAHVEKSVLVSDAAIAEAQAMLWRHLRIVAEPGGAAALAALVSGAYPAGDDEHVGVLVSGANTAAVDFSR